MVLPGSVGCTAWCGIPTHTPPEKVPVLLDGANGAIPPKITDERGGDKVIPFHWGWRTHLEAVGKAQGFRSPSFFPPP